MDSETKDPNGSVKGVEDDEINGRYARYVLLVLIVVYIFNFIDRGDGAGLCNSWLLGHGSQVAFRCNVGRLARSVLDTRRKQALALQLAYVQAIPGIG